MSRKKIFSLFVILLGLMSLYFGINEYRILSSAYNPLFTISPDNDTMALLIFGAAATVAGFVGLIRKSVL